MKTQARFLMVPLLLFMAIFGLLVAAPKTYAQSYSTEYEARLTVDAAYAGAKGEADYEERTDGSLVFEAELERLNRSLSGQSFNVVVDDVTVGTAVVNRKGEAKFKADSRRGQTVPAVVEGSTVAFTNGTGVVASGVFNLSNDSDDDSDDNPGGGSGNTTDLESQLVAGAAYPTARGESDYEVNSLGNAEFEVEVKRVSSLRGQTLSVSVDGTQVGTMVVNSKGEAKLKLQTSRGQVVPAVVVGSLVEVSATGGVVASGVFSLSNDSDDNSGGGSGSAVEMETRLIPSAAYPTARGESDYEVNSQGNAEFEVEVKRVSSLRGQTLSVSVDGTQVGTMVVNSRGEAKLKLQTSRGQTVPAIVAGSLVEVSASGGIVASGSY